MKFSRLSHLNLSYSGFSGQIPSEILELTMLETLDLSEDPYYNKGLKHQKSDLKGLVEKLTNLKVLVLNEVNISTSIPHILANLSSLTYLSLDGCNLQGEFPTDIFWLPYLNFLDVSRNEDLKGCLPKFDKNSSLKELGLLWTRFSGQIPNSIGNLKSLSRLYIGSSNIWGTIPSSIGNLTQLKQLMLVDNDFTGELPTSMGNLRSVEELDVDNCGISGQLPSSMLGNLTQLNRLSISFNKFSGPNSLSFSGISKLTKLTELLLYDINFVGEIPPSFNNLTKLTFLGMDGNKINGPIPFWLSQLTGLSLKSTQLTGCIPTQIQNLSQLQDLDLSINQLQGSIPSSIFELKNLSSLILDSNNLSGTVELDTVLGKAKSLDMLSLSSNKLSLISTKAVNTSSQKFVYIGFRSCSLTELPTFLRSQDQLVWLDLSSNNITGEIPGWFLEAITDSLLSLNLSHNLLTGIHRQPVLLPWKYLFSMDLRYNKLQGSLPIPPISTTRFLVSNNNLTGNIPSSICNSHHLRAFDLSNNKLSGVLPQCLGNFSSDLTVLALHGNKFYGSIPQTFMNGTNLKMIDLSNNLLQGRIPRSLASCTRLELLNLGNNHIVDLFPSWLGTLPELQVLILQSNNFYGTIKEPKTKFDFPKLRIIDLSQNRFRGELPSKYFQHWKAMKVINASQLLYMEDELSSSSVNGYGMGEYEYPYSLRLINKGIEMEYEKISKMVIGILLSSNEFTGEIPESIANLKGIQNLNLSNNNLFGHIPSCLGNLTALESLDLSNNKISGKIPQQLAQLTTLAYLNVSHNQLTGPIPQGTQFDGFPNSSFDGNPGLFGRYFSKNCISKAPSQEEVQDSSYSPFRFDWKIVLIIGYASGIVTGVALGQAFTTTGKYEWFATMVERQLKRIKRRRRQRN